MGILEITIVVCLRIAIDVVIQLALTMSHDGCYGGIARDIHHGANHIQKAVYPNDQRDPLYG